MKRQKSYKLISDEKTKFKRSFQKRKKHKKYSIKLFFKIKKYISIILILILIFCLINLIFKLKNDTSLSAFLNKNYKLNEEKEILNKTPILEKDRDEEFKDIQEFLDMAVNGTLYKPNEIYYKSKVPKISVIITVYNGEGFLKTTLLSIQNQNFKDIEIIMIDDCSKDNSINLIKELMIKDPRVKLIQNEENRGALYTRAKGALNAEGKYLMFLDIDDFYMQKDVFLTLYLEAEKNNLDIIKYAYIWYKSIHLPKDIKVYENSESPIIYQPNIKKTMHEYNNNGEVKRVGGLIYNCFFKTEIFVKSVKQIDDKYLNLNWKFHDDFLLYFLISRNAKAYKHIKRIFYHKFINEISNNNEKKNFREIEKKKNTHNNACLAYINYIEFILIKTDNTITDKKIASCELKDWFLNNGCRRNELIKNQAIHVCNLFLENEYIDNSVKTEIKNYLSQTNSM